MRAKGVKADERCHYKIEPKELINVCMACKHKDCADNPCKEYRRVAAELRANGKAKRREQNNADCRCADGVF